MKNVEYPGCLHVTKQPNMIKQLHIPELPDEMPQIDTD